jgi:hypothetical protein
MRFIARFHARFIARSHVRFHARFIARFLVEGSRISQNILCVGIQEFYFGIIIFYFFHTNLFLEFENLET